MTPYKTLTPIAFSLLLTACQQTSPITVTTAGPPSDTDSILSYQEKVNGHAIELSIHWGDYDFSKHTLSGGMPGDTETAKVDGIEFAGTDGESPFHFDPDKKTLEIIRDIRLKWDGETIDVPKRLHINLLNLPLIYETDWKSLQVSPNQAGDTLLIQVTGGDGGASYLALIVLRKNGKHKQVIQYWEDSPPTTDEAWIFINEP